MKVAVVLFHKNIHRYPEQWVQQCVDSIKAQTYKDFQVFELDYGAGMNQVYKGSQSLNIVMNNHAEALNYLLEYVFSLGYDCAFNVNIDDYYAPDRFARQIKYIVQGYDIVSSNFHIVNENNEIIHSQQMHDRDMREEAAKGTNIIAHPVICYSKNFKGKLIPEQIPSDDFELWKRCYGENQYKFIILPEYLLYYRSHELKVS